MLPSMMPGCAMRRFHDANAVLVRAVESRWTHASRQVRHNVQYSTVPWSWSNLSQAQWFQPCDEVRRKDIQTPARQARSLQWPCMHSSMQQRR